MYSSSCLSDKQENRQDVFFPTIHLIQTPAVLRLKHLFTHEARLNHSNVSHFCILFLVLHHCVSSILFPAHINYIIFLVFFLIHPQTNQSFEAQEVASLTKNPAQPLWRQKVISLTLVTFIKLLMTVCLDLVL